MCPVIFEKLPKELRLIISGNNNKNNWNFTKILNLINVELKVCEACAVRSHTAAEGKNGFRFSSPSHTPYTGSSIVSGSSSVHTENRKLEKGVVKTTHCKVVGGNVFFVTGTTGRTNVGLSQKYRLGRYVEKRKPLFHVSENSPQQSKLSKDKTLFLL